MGALIDKDGVVHQKGWDGQYRPKQGWFGPEKAKDFLGNPRVERDFFGNPRVQRDWLGRPVRSSQGGTLFRPSGGGSNSSGGSGEGALMWFAIVVVVGALIIGTALFLLLIVPIFITLWHGLSTKSGRKDLGIFAISFLCAGGLIALAGYSVDAISQGHYEMWIRVLLPLAAVGSWIGILWLAAAQRWFRPVGMAVLNVFRGYWSGIVTMWDKIWSVV